MSDIISLRRMLKNGVPRGAVEMKCVQAGLDPAQLDEVKSSPPSPAHTFTALYQHLPSLPPPALLQCTPLIHLHTLRDTFI